jgi:hypothetical protein
MQRQHKSRQAEFSNGIQTGFLQGSRTPQFALAPAQLYNQPTAALQTPPPVSTARTKNHD